MFSIGILNSLLLHFPPLIIIVNSMKTVQVCHEHPGVLLQAMPRKKKEKKKKKKSQCQHEHPQITILDQYQFVMEIVGYYSRPNSISHPKHPGLLFKTKTVFATPNTPGYYSRPSSICHPKHLGYYSRPSKGTTTLTGT